MSRFFFLASIITMFCFASQAQKVSISKDLIVGSEDLPTEAISPDTLMFFDYEKAAFRAGNVSTSGAYWAPSKIGFGSFAANRNTTASGDYSSAFGNRSTASGDRSFAAGYFAVASGLRSFAAGEQAEAIGLRSFAVGYQAEALGSYSGALGRYVLADSYASHAVGSYNLGGGDPANWVGTDPIFEVGIGQSNATRENGLTVLKNGNTGIGTATPAEKLTVEGDVNVTGEIKANGVSGQSMQLLSADGNGGMNWIDMNLFSNFFDVNQSATNVLWVVPADVEQICVELWGAGGGGSAGGGGGAGGYLKTIIQVTPGQTLTLDVGAGGAGVSGGALMSGGNGEFSSCSGTDIFILAGGGTGASITSPGSGGGYGTPTAVSYITRKGEDGRPNRNRMVQIGSTTFELETTHGSGGNPAFFPKNGGLGELWQKGASGFVFQNEGTDGYEPGGGGGGGNVSNNGGADGYIIVRW